ncbi:MAG: carbohydrate ABC transporter substrate-binding protein [Coprococcus sp.]
MALSFAGCGEKEGDSTEAKSDATTEATTAAQGDDTTTEAASEDTTTVTSDEGKTLNIYVWNEEFKERVEEFYDGYEKVDATTGKIGDVEVKWTITPNDNNAYQDNLDATLLAQADAAADDKIDMFLVEADYALKYVDTEYTLPVADLGITDAELADQYQYTKDVMTDSNGVLKGVSWQGCPAGLIYNRAIAKDVWGTDDPAEVQEHVKDWDSFYAAGAEMAAKGYLLTSTVNDTYRVYSNNVSSKWVTDDLKLNIDPNIEKWAKDAKAMADAKYTQVADLWSDEWKTGFFPEGKCFSYFGPMWMIDFSMSADQEGSVGYDGGWGLVTGPQGFFWGGTWMCAATGTDNPTLVADIMRQLTTNSDTMTKISKEKSDFVNNKTAMATIAADTSFGSKPLGGQNPYGMLAEGAEKIDLSTISAYDQGCNEEFQKAMKDYFLGNYDYDAAIAAFKSAVSEKYPALTVE